MTQEQWKQTQTAMNAGGVNSKLFNCEDLQFNNKQDHYNLGIAYCLATSLFVLESLHPKTKIIDCSAICLQVETKLYFLDFCPSIYIQTYHAFIPERIKLTEMYKNTLCISLGKLTGQIFYQHLSL